MIALVTGGASSGKSAFAETLAISLPGPHIYLATMRHGDAETEARIERHRLQRAGKGFTTVEADSSVCTLPEEGTVLLEDLGNLVANGWDLDLDRLFACGNVVVVGNEVGCDGASYDAFTRDYIRQIGALACSIAERADVVVEVVAGIPHAVKGELPWVS